MPLILLRHAKALPKSGWKRADADRPLDDSGRADAKTLADLLTCFAPRARLISSTAARCTETLRPLAQLTGERVREVPALYIHDKSSGTGSADSGQDIDSLIRAAIAAGEPTVVCAHRENLPDLRAAALAALTGHVAAGSSPAVRRAASPVRAAQGVGRHAEHVRLLGAQRRAVAPGPAAGGGSRGSPRRRERWHPGRRRARCGGACCDFPPATPP